MKEWNDPFNPFNSMKVLMWKKHLEHCSRDDYLPPVTVDVDPSNRCNYKCIWCNAYDMIKCSHQDMPEEHMLKLADFFKNWRNAYGYGPHSACVAGGGEPLMNKGTPAFLERMHSNGLENGLITNGSLLTDEIIDIIARTCRWVGFSMDAASLETYNHVKGLPSNSKILLKVSQNIRQLTQRVRHYSTKCDVAFKFLMHPDNAHEIYDAACWAKALGCKDFHCRPVGWENLTITKEKDKLYWTDLTDTINKQMKAALAEESQDFHIYGVRHKFSTDFSKGKKNFKRCWAIPILPTFGADGNVHCCFDLRGNPDLIMCKHYPDPTEVLRYWNSEEHKALIRSIDVEKCPRCTFSLYNEAVEKAIIEDRMCYKFP
jgi:MoaA/NifB/PqqE/SkfB family radical SAM enzyme